MVKLKMKRQKLEERNRGITLIALVITIIVLLILAGVSIAMLTGENGILTQAQRAKTETENAQAEEENILASYENYLNSYSGENTEFTDSLGNKVKVPAGFRVVNPEDNVEDGIIIEDVTHGATAGSQFVWIPLGTIKTSKGEKIITLGRYSFDNSGVASPYSGSYTEDTVAEHIYDNTPAKNIEEFTTSATSNGGYYIGRYEARDKVATEARTTSTSDTNQLVCNYSNYVYGWVTQPQAATLCQSMYKDSNFESDLINSYAWDTATLFIQECSGDTGYSKQASLNEDFEERGTNIDVKCNIYDMASNCNEWTTETYNKEDSFHCVVRGGVCYNSDYCESDRYLNDTSYSNFNTSFRPLLYIK